MEHGRWLGALLWGTAFCLVGPLAYGADVATGSKATAAGGGRSPTEWLRAIRTAAQRANYIGTIVYQRGDEVRSSRIVHFFDGAGPRETRPPHMHLHNPVHATRISRCPMAFSRPRFDGHLIQ